MIHCVNGPSLINMLWIACDECPRYEMNAMNAYCYELYAMKRMFPENEYI
jgi:hypothetical protein